LQSVVNRLALELYFTKAALEDGLPVAKSILGALRNSLPIIFVIYSGINNKGKFGISI
jgi:hypothetical protein